MPGFKVNRLQKEGNNLIAQKQTPPCLPITSFQKGFAHLFLIVLLLIGIGSGMYLVQHPQIFKSRAAENRLCTANSVVSLRDCINKVNANLMDVIEVQNMITCQKADGCEFNIVNIHRPIQIKGKKGIKAGIKRLDWFENPVLRITNSEKIYVTDLVFDENDQVKCAPYSNFANVNDPNNKNSCGIIKVCASEITPCNPTIVVGASNNTYFDNVEVLYSKWIGLALYDGSGHRISNSLFKGTEDLRPDGRPNGSGWYGFWTWNNTKQYEFINNRLINQQSNTGIFTSNTEINKRTVVKGNFFQNDGTLDLVRSGGGTIGVIPNFHYGDVIFNEVIDAKAAYNPMPNEQYYTPNGGIEIDVLGQELLPPGVDANSQVHHANFMGNVLHGIEGNYGIGIGDKAFYNNVNIGKNVIYDIRALYPNWEAKPIIIYAGDARVYDNCLNNPSCPIPAYSTFTATPDVCFPGSDGKCNSTVRWSSKSYGDVVIKNRKTGAELGRGANGAADFNWANNSGEAVDLYSSGQLVESLVVRDGKLHEELNIASKGSIASQPAQCQLNGQTECGVKINWDLSQYPNPNANIEVRLRETGTLFGAGGIRGSGDVTWITAEGFHFDLYADGLPYDSVFVKGVGGVQPSPSPSPSPTSPGPTGVLTAIPNPCQLLVAQGVCTSRISWIVNNPRPEGVVVKVRSTGQGLGGGSASGGADATGITAEGVTFDLYSGPTLLHSIIVKGTPPATGAPIGSFDGIDGSQIAGWVCDLDMPSTASYVEMYIDDYSVGYSPADKPAEQGVADACGGFKDHRFLLEIPDQYKDG